MIHTSLHNNKIFQLVKFFFITANIEAGQTSGNLYLKGDTTIQNK